MSKNAKILVLLSLLITSHIALAGLFDDDEARKNITDLDKKIDSQKVAIQSSLDAIKKDQRALENQINDVQNLIKSQGMMDLLNQVESLSHEVSHLQGEIEVLQHGIDVTQQHQKELYADIDARLRKLEMSLATIANATPVSSQATTEVKNGDATNVTNNTNTIVANAVSPAAKSPQSNVAQVADDASTYAAAMDLLKNNKFMEAFVAFNQFIQAYPTSKIMPDALYGLGFSQFSLKNFKAAIATQQKLINDFPNSPRVVEAKFNIANCQVQLSDIAGATATLKALINDYPDSDLIPNAKRRLSILESIH